MMRDAAYPQRPEYIEMGLSADLSIKCPTSTQQWRLKSFRCQSYGLVCSHGAGLENALFSQV